jgi:hypothetical protein
MTDPPKPLGKSTRSGKGNPPAPGDTLGALHVAAPAAAPKAAKPRKRAKPVMQVKAAGSPKTVSPSKTASPSKIAAPSKTAIPSEAARPKKSAAAPKTTAAVPVKPNASAEPAGKPQKRPSERTKPLNFRVTAEFRKAFKQAAANEDCKKVELLERLFREWQKRQPKTP